MKIFGFYLILFFFFFFSFSKHFISLQPSSCLSDKEEDEIYGFGYGVFAPRVGRPAVLHPPTTTVNVHHHPQNHTQPQQQLSSSQPIQHQQIVHPQQHLPQQLQHVPAGQQRCLFKRNLFSFCFYSICVSLCSYVQHVFCFFAIICFVFPVFLAVLLDLIYICVCMCLLKYNSLTYYYFGHFSLSATHLFVMHHVCEYVCVCLSILFPYFKFAAFHLLLFGSKLITFAMFVHIHKCISKVLGLFSYLYILPRWAFIW